MTLAEELTRYGVQCSATKGKVTLEAVPEDLDSLCDAEGCVTDPGLNAFLDRLDKFEAYLDYHPYGSDGGFVFWVEDGQKKACYLDDGWTNS